MAAQLIDLLAQPDVVRQENLTLVYEPCPDNWGSLSSAEKEGLQCCSTDFYVDPEYSAEGDYAGENCHVDSIPPESIEERFKDKGRVKSCCPMEHGYLAVGICSAQDNEGQEVSLSNVEVCQSHLEVDDETDEKKQYKKINLECPLGCRTITGVLPAEPDLKPNKKGELILTTDGKNYSNFCLSYMCKYVTWELDFDACHCEKKNIPEENRKLKEVNPDTPFCCGSNGILDEKNMECKIQQESENNTLRSTSTVTDSLPSDFNVSSHCRNKEVEELSVVYQNNFNKYANLSCVSMLEKKNMEQVPGGLFCNRWKTTLLQAVQLENKSLKLTLNKVQSQLDTSLDAQEQQRKVLEAINRQFGDHLHRLGQLQIELTQVLNT